MSISINDTLQNNSPKSLDGKYLKLGSVVFTSVSDANTTILSAYRSIGLTVNISNVEYWYKDGTLDGNLVIKDNVPQIQTDWTQGSSGATDFIKNKPTLSLVATSGSYPDLANKPTIPSQFAPIAGTNITLTGTYPNITFNSTGGGGGSGSTLATVTYTANQTALVGDLDKLVFLSPASANLTYTVNPSTFSGRVLRIYGIPGAFTISVTPSSGSIGGNPSYGLFDQECINIFSDGTNLFIIAKN